MQEIYLRAAAAHVHIKVVATTLALAFHVVVVDDSGLLLAGDDLYLYVGLLLDLLYAVTV